MQNSIFAPIDISTSANGGRFFTWRTGVRHAGLVTSNREASMIGDLTNDRIFGLTLTAILVAMLILNATSY